MWGGRQFDITVRETKQPDRSYWIAAVQVVGKEGLQRSHATFTGLSDGDAREQVQKWIVAWRN